MTDLVLINPSYFDYGKGRNLLHHTYSILEVAPPLGLLYVGANAINAGYKVKLIDMEAEVISYKELKSRIKRLKPQLVGITCPTALFNISVELSKIIKSVVDVPIVIGGPHTIMDIDSILENETIDFCLRGESDVTIVPLLDYLIKQTGRIEDVKSLSYRKDTTIVHNKVSGSISDLNTVPFPARQLLKKNLYFNLFTETATCTSIVTSRGCPYKCIYCAPIYTRGRQRSVENVVSEIRETVDRYKIKDFQFFDETFNLNPQWTIDFCNELVKQNISIFWRARCRPDLFTQEVVQCMKKAGCRIISMGVESANDNTLNWFKKGYNRKQIQNAINIIAEEGIELHGFFILGAPVENKEEMIKTIDLACMPQFSYASFYILTPLEGTQFLDIALKEGYIDVHDQIDYSDQTGFNARLKHPSMTTEEIELLLKYAYNRFYFRLAPFGRFFKRIISNPFLYCKMIQRVFKGIKIFG